MRCFIRFVILGWNSPSNLDEPPAAATVRARWRQWRDRDHWPGSFTREIIAAFDAGWKDGQRGIERIYAEHGMPYTPQDPPWHLAPASEEQTA